LDRLGCWGVPRDAESVEVGFIVILRRACR
jgi:hypothetical protein